MSINKFPSSIGELKQLIVDIWRPSIKTLTDEKVNKNLTLTIDGVTQDLSSNRSWTTSGSTIEEYNKSMLLGGM